MASSRGNKSDIGQFAIVPLWLLQSGVSATAIQLFAIFSCKYVDRDTHEAFPSRKTLAADIGAKSRTTVDKALAELKVIGALTSEARLDEAGDWTTNLYTLHYAQAGGVNHCDGGQVSLQNGGQVSRQTGHKPESVEPESIEPKTSTDKGSDLKKQSHRRHVYCGQRFCVPDFLHEQFERQLAEERDQVELTGLDGFYATLDHESDRPIAEDPLQFLKRRFTADIRTLFPE